MAQVQKTHERFNQQPDRSRASQKDLFNLAGAGATTALLPASARLAAIGPAA